LGDQNKEFYFLFGKTDPHNKEEGLICGYIKKDEKTSEFYAVSPGVLEEVRKINPNLKGAPMETKKRNGVVYPHHHWHGRKFTRDINCDLMTPSSDRKATLSAVTVAMINDFGWYKIDLDSLNQKMEEYVKGSDKKK
jgi:hypothetical protein